MPTDCITYQNTGYFSKLIVDYLNEKPELLEFYHRFPRLENFDAQILDKKSNFDDKEVSNAKRATLVSVLKEQYAAISTSELTAQNIDWLQNKNTFTITTGHQLNLCSGPLYFLYKIIATINLCQQLKKAYPAYNFVPIYWMATEDHDFEEINYFNFQGKKIRWNKESSGPVGRLSTDGLETVFDIFSKELGTSTNATEIKNLFKKSYLEHDNLADATRFLANEWFGKQGLVILDADNTSLKKEFSPYIKNELLHQNSYNNVTQTIQKLKEYPIQVNPREINLFYIEDNLRERIVFEDGIYKVNNTQITFSEAAILIELENNPEKFSPNVILRPLYQEVILPNLCYIGGGGEIAYWLELQSYFNSQSITFPMLLVRNSVLISSKKQSKKADQLNLTWSDLFLKQADLIQKKTKELSQFTIDFAAQKAVLRQQFENLLLIAQQTDPSFRGAVKAQEVKQTKGLENLEKRLLKAEKRKHAEILDRITDLQNQLFPNKSLQERQTNFSEPYLEYGTQLFALLNQELKPLEQFFAVIEL
jgi:bacillithiol synthase